jgi:hypothetical protein
VKLCKPQQRLSANLGLAASREILTCGHSTDQG